MIESRSAKSFGGRMTLNDHSKLTDVGDDRARRCLDVLELGEIPGGDPCREALRV
jgi:hypothetical protein